MKKESSAGGIVVRKKFSRWEVLLIRDMNGSWTFPKGLIEKGEAPVESAKREIAEEVGIHNLKLLTTLAPIHYMYRRNGLISKTVQYFLFHYVGRESPTVQKEEGISQALWMPLMKAMRVVGYATTNKKLLKEAKQYL